MTRIVENFVTSKNVKFGYLAVFLGAAVLYVATCAPGPGL